MSAVDPNIEIKPGFDASFYRAVVTLEFINESTGHLLPSDFVEKFLLEIAEVENVSQPAVGAGVDFVIKVSDDNIKFLTALLAVDPLVQGEVPFHEFIISKLTEKLQEGKEAA